MTLTDENVSRILITEIVKTMEVKYNMTNKQVNDFFQTKNEKQKTHLRLVLTFLLTWGGRREAVGVPMTRGQDTRS